MIRAVKATNKKRGGFVDKKESDDEKNVNKSPAFTISHFDDDKDANENLF